MVTSNVTNCQVCTQNPKCAFTEIKSKVGCLRGDLHASDCRIEKSPGLNGLELCEV